MPDLAERYQHVRLLLLTLDDPYPRPKSLLVPDSGPAPSRYVPCETCRERGEVRVRGGWMLCLVCDGVGWKRREHGEEAWDAYLELPLVEAAALPRASRARRPEEPSSQEPAYAWERAIQVHDRHGSYQALRRALVWLQTANPRRARLVRRVLVAGEELELSGSAALELELGVVMLTLRLGPVRVPPWLVERSSRSETVQSLHSQGLSPGQIARQLGMSKKAVQRKIRAGIRGKVGATPEPLPMRA